MIDDANFFVPSEPHRRSEGILGFRQTKSGERISSATDKSPFEKYPYASDGLVPRFFVLLART
jgi:hypothetical protein